MYAAVFISAMNHLITVFIILFLSAGCATNPISVTYETDRFGVPVPVVDGVAYPMTQAEREAIGRAFIDAYCR